MKKLLLSTAAIGLAFAATPAHADVDLELGGYFSGYGAFVDQDYKNNTTDTNSFDLLKDTEIHFSGETTLDSGLVVGAHIEFDVDKSDTNAAIDESYAYFSGSWGRVNFGDEDGAGYLLQVAAPSADSNVDGIRTYINPVDYDSLDATGKLTGDVRFAYQMDATGKDTKLTYLSPIMNGFQLGLSYAPDDGSADDLNGVRTTDVVSADGGSYEVAFRYEGMFENVGVNFGAGYAQQDLEAKAAQAAGVKTDDRQEWNVGLDLDFGPFGVGVVYSEDNHNEVRNAGNTATINDEEILAVGVDYTTGAFKLGASYYDSENSLGVDGLDTKRYTGGVVYTYGPGMTFRGSVSYIDHDLTGIGGAGNNSADATSVLLGTNVKF